MIQSDRELEIVKEQIAFLKRARDGVFRQSDSEPFMMHLSASSFESKMRQLWQEVNEYETRLGGVRQTEIERLPNAAAAGGGESALVPAGDLDPAP